MRSNDDVFSTVFEPCPIVATGLARSRTHLDGVKKKRFRLQARAGYLRTFG